MATLKPQSDGPLYSNTVIGTLAVDGWAVTFGTAPHSSLLAVPNVKAHSAIACVPTSYYSMWHYNYLWRIVVEAQVAPSFSTGAPKHEKLRFFAEIDSFLRASCWTQAE